MNLTYPFLALNNQIISVKKLQFPFDDFGLLYGYGLFETILIEKSQPAFLIEHLQRLKRGANFLQIKFQCDFNHVERTIFKLIQKNKIETAILNIYLTTPKKNSPFDKENLYIILRPLGEFKENIKLGLKKEELPRTKFNGHKTLSFGKSFFEKRNFADFDDILLYNSKKEILETTTANVFFIKGKTLLTPKSNLILPGIIRQQIIRNHQKWNFKLELRKVYLEELNEFEEIFLTSSLRKIILVKKLDYYPKLKSKEKTLTLTLAKTLPFLF